MLLCHVTSVSTHLVRGDGNVASATQMLQISRIHIRGSGGAERMNLGAGSAAAALCCHVTPEAAALNVSSLLVFGGQGAALPND